MSRRRPSAGSVFWGIILVTIGALLLARNLGYVIPIWGPLAKYWPVLIIAWGMLKLVDYFRLRNDPDRRPVFSGGEVAMLIFVLFAGTAMTAAANMSPEIGQFFDFPMNFDFWDITGSMYQYTEHHELEAAAGSRIRVFNLYGSIDVKPADSDRIILDVEKSVRATDRAEADDRSKDFTFSIKNEGGVLTVVSNRDEGGVWGTRTGRTLRDRQRFKSNLVLKVPRKAALDVNNKYGTVEIAGLEGTQSVENKYGSTSIHEITGAVTVTAGYGTAILENIQGDTNVTNSHASTTLREITGKVVAENKYGSVDVQHVTSDASIENQYSVVNVQTVAGSVTIRGRNNSVDVDDAGGDVDVETSYKNLSVRNAKGRIRLTNRHGSVDVELAQAPTNDITVNAEYSDVSLELPANAAFSIDGQTRYGEIDSEFDSMSINSSGRDRTLRGQHGNGGPRITVETRNGSIHLEKRG